MERILLLIPRGIILNFFKPSFDFVRKEEGAGFENQKLFIIRYTKDYEVKLVEDDTVSSQK